MKARHAGWKRRLSMTAVIAGAGLLVAPLCWTVADEYGDYRRIAVAIGASSLMLGAVNLLPGGRQSALLLPPLVSGLVVVLFGVMLLWLGTGYTHKGTQYLRFTFWLVGLLVIVTGLFRCGRSLRRS